MTEYIEVYDDTLPVEDGWAEDHRREIWTFRMVVHLYELIEANGIEAVNDLCDERTGVTLSGLTYEIGHPDPEDELGKRWLILEATGVVD